VVADKATGEILGVHIIGPEATEIIHEFTLGAPSRPRSRRSSTRSTPTRPCPRRPLEATLAALGQANHI